MDKSQLRKIAKTVMVRDLASRSNDPRFYAGLTVLPNPDPILRKLGKADEIFDAILSDSHVIGEVRTMRAGFNNYKFKVVSGDDGDAKANEAAELARHWLANYKPGDGLTWRDVFWNMGTAVLYGFRVHVIEWEFWRGHIFPVRVMDRPNRRFKFDTDNKLRLLTKDQPYEGEETEDRYFVATRHMPSHENPYGRALLSSCYWPYTFKHGGLKFFFQYCERFGLPWPIGRYPAGTTPEDQNALQDALLNLMESGAATIPEGDTIELLEVKGGTGKLAQEALIQLCNREMSKALTSQTLATETQETGARAASETHAARQGDVTQSDRGIVESGMSQIFAWLTELNFGDEVAAPIFEFFLPKNATENEVRVWKEAATVSKKVPLKAFHERMGIPMAEDGEEVLVVNSTAPVNLGGNEDGEEFAAPCKQCGHVHTFNNGDDHVDETQTVVDKAIEDKWLQPLADMFASYEKAGKSLADIRRDLPKFFGTLDNDQVQYLISQAMQLSFAQGVEAQA